MPENPTNEEVARSYARASSELDDETLARLRHPDWQVRWPQSGERVLGTEAFRAITDHYPGGRPSAEVERVVGVEDRWVVTAANNVLRVAGGGDFWWCEWRMTYPDGRVWDCVDLLELREGKVWRETVYWATPFDAPSWRRQWVELEAGASQSAR
jgi:hypothetical protein